MTVDVANNLNQVVIHTNTWCGFVGVIEVRPTPRGRLRWDYSYRCEWLRGKLPARLLAFGAGEVVYSREAAIAAALDAIHTEIANLQPQTRNDRKRRDYVLRHVLTHECIQ